MAEHSSIEWTDATWNPITGCSLVSPGCTHCYAMRLAGTRLRHHASRAGLTIDTKAGPVWNGEVRLNAEWLTQPLHWRRPRMIFVCAHGDLFHERVPDAWIDRVFAVMALAPQHTFQVLTKRPARMRAYLSDPGLLMRLREAVCQQDIVAGADWASDIHFGADYGLPLPNVWPGVSAEDQQRADERREDLAGLAASGWLTFASYEPALGRIDWRGWEFLRWLISGGESGPEARPSHPEWHRAARDFCASHGIAYFFKQWGTWRAVSEGAGDWFNHLYRSRIIAREGESQAALDDLYGRKCTVPQIVLTRDGIAFDDVAAPGAYLSGSGSMLMFRVGKKVAGRLLDGVEHNGMPGARS